MIDNYFRKAVQNSDVVFMRYLRHVLKNSSLYPIGTFWLFTVLIVPATMLKWLNHGHAMIFMTFVAMSLLIAADRRDMKAANAALEAQLAEVRTLVVERSDIQDTAIAQINTNTEKDTDVSAE
jgi:hypothetical protein